MQKAVSRFGVVTGVSALALSFGIALTSCGNPSGAPPSQEANLAEKDDGRAGRNFLILLDGELEEDETLVHFSVSRRSNIAQLTELSAEVRAMLQESGELSQRVIVSALLRFSNVTGEEWSELANLSIAWPGEGGGHSWLLIAPWSNHIEASNLHATQPERVCTARLAESKKAMEILSDATSGLIELDLAASILYINLLGADGCTGLTSSSRDALSGAAAEAWRSLDDREVAGNCAEPADCLLHRPELGGRYGDRPECLGRARTSLQMLLELVE